MPAILLMVQKSGYPPGMYQSKPIKQLCKSREIPINSLQKKAGFQKKTINSNLSACRLLTHVLYGVSCEVKAGTHLLAMVAAPVFESPESWRVIGQVRELGLKISRWFRSVLKCLPYIDGVYIKVYIIYIPHFKQSLKCTAPPNKKAGHCNVV